MRRIITFILGMLVGGLLLLAALNYHVIRAQDGLHFLPKTSARLSSSYVDIRNFTVADYMEHPEIVEALIRADQAELVDGAARGALQNGLNRWLGPE